MASGKVLDPICDMVVDLDEARETGLTLEYGDREYAFCSAGCQEKFAKNRNAYVSKVDAWLAKGGEGVHATTGDAAHAHAATAELPEIDAGMRSWYASCRCCLSDAYPRVVEVLDAERASTRQAPADAGICETAEAHEPKTT